MRYSPEAKIRQSRKPSDWPYRRQSDNKKISVKLFTGLSFTFVVTHEICLITAKACYYPFHVLSGEKQTIVCGSSSKEWQQEELKTLRPRGWAAHLYATGQWAMPSSKSVLEEVIALATGRPIVDLPTDMVIHGLSVSEDLLSGFQFKEKGSAGIELAWGQCGDALWD